jgi:2-(1,2-epoxy-1,2-dihydrophenyl)acetyl-CoA isomerase
MYENIQVSTADCIQTITLNRPDRLNAFIGHMRRDLAEALEHAASDRNVRVVVITGAGRGFCAGGDVAFMAELMQRRNAEEFSRILGAGRRVILAIRQMTKPVIAAINGPASGAGCNLALACDLRIASSASIDSPRKNISHAIFGVTRRGRKYDPPQSG